MYNVSGIKINPLNIQNTVLITQHIKPLEQQIQSTDEKMYSNAKPAELGSIMNYNSNKKVDVKYIASAFLNVKMSDIQTKTAY